MSRESGPARPLNILILYDGVSVPVNTIRDHMDSFRLFSRHRIHYAHAAFEALLRFPLSLFDAIIIHYCVRLPMRHHLSSAFFRALQEYRGLKALFIQDEYEHTWLTSERITQLGIDVVFTCVPPSHVRSVYSRVPQRVEFFQNLTGYVPLNFDSTQPVRPLEQRPFLIGYRGRPLSYHYGRLAHEKVLIARRMRAICQARNLSHDIEWAEQKRIYGADWNEFIQSCRTMLGTESGANVFDHDGRLRARVQEALLSRPDLTFEDVYARFLQGKEVDGMMNQVSPRVFEAVALRTGLILFEGHYSGVVRPDEHYIPLRKDFRNVDEVLARAQDQRSLQAMIDRAYDHVIGSGLYTYQQFIRWVDQVLEPRVEQKQRQAPADEKDVARLIESGDLESSPGPRTRPSRAVESLWIARSALFDPRRSLPRLARVAWNVLLRLVWTGPLRLLEAAYLGLVKTARFLPTLLTVPLLRRSLRQGIGLAPELARLIIVRQARLAGSQPLGFEVVPRVHTGPTGTSLLLISLPTSLVGKETCDRLALERALDSGLLGEVVWDHSAIGSSIRYPLQGKFTAPFALGRHGVYRFQALAELARSQPEQVRDLLRWALVAQDQETEKHETILLQRRAG